MYFNHYTDEEKNEIVKQLKTNTEQIAADDYKKLYLAITTDMDNIKPLSPIGLKFIEHFVHNELLNTKSKHGISFYDFWYNRDFYLTRDQSTKNLIKSINTNKPYLSEIKVAKQVFNLYYGGISILRPTVAARLYAQYKPTTVLDFTMGWGGRLVGAHILKVPKYIGIDSNMNLVEPYAKMRKFLQKESNNETAIELHFKDALSIDYSTMTYDMVFTSPPFYNKELYGDKMVKMTTQEWDNNFYIPLFKKTMANLAPGGHYCLLIPVQLYENVCIPLFGPAQEQIELKKYARILPKKEQKQTNVGQKYKEFIYVWKGNQGSL